MPNSGSCRSAVRSAMPNSDLDSQACCGAYFFGFRQILIICDVCYSTTVKDMFVQKAMEVFKQNLLVMKTSLRDVITKEPEYTKEELKRMESKKRKAPNTSSSPSTDEDDLDNSRLENLHWCKCGQCIIFLETSLRECVCCKEYSDLLGGKLNDIRCISYHDEFKTLCLDLFF